MSKIDVNIDEARCDLAAIFRWSARESMHEGIANHFSYAISDDGQQFLMNPFGVHFSKMQASDLLLLDTRKPPIEFGKKVDNKHMKRASTIEFSDLQMMKRYQ